MVAVYVSHSEALDLHRLEDLARDLREPWLEERGFLSWKDYLKLFSRRDTHPGG